MNKQEPKPKNRFVWIIPILFLLVYFAVLRPMLVEAVGGGGVITSFAAAVTGAVGVGIGTVIDYKMAS